MSLFSVYFCFATFNLAFDAVTYCISSLTFNAGVIFFFPLVCMVGHFKSDIPASYTYVTRQAHVETNLRPLKGFSRLRDIKTHKHS